MAFTTVALAELALVFAVRSPIHAALAAPRNPYLLGSVVLSIAVVLGAVYLPFLNDPLGTVPLDSDELRVTTLLALLPFLCVEAGKALARRAGWRLEGASRMRRRPSTRDGTREWFAITCRISSTERTTGSSRRSPSSRAWSAPTSPSGSFSSSGSRIWSQTASRWVRATSSPAARMPTRRTAPTAREAMRHGTATLVGFLTAGIVPLIAYVVPASRRLSLPARHRPDALDAVRRRRRSRAGHPSRLDPQRARDARSSAPWPRLSPTRSEPSPRR